MTKTYTIAYDEILFACMPDGGDLEAELARFEDEARVEIDRDRLTIEGGLLLVDEPEEGDEVRYSGFAMGVLTDESGESFFYAVRRPGGAS